MKTKLTAALALAAGLSVLPACASGTYAGVGYSYYDGYYDNYYGPVRYGYWGPDNYFYYAHTVHGPYVRDEARHFRREQWERSRHFHMRGRPDGH
jgi:hypothetical protein